MSADAEPQRPLVAPPLRQVRAHFDETTVRVYQAYPREIAEPAIAAQTFVPPFKRERMTWIKPSFTWMMYRSGCGTKLGQERVLAIDITRSGFERALAMACTSHFEPTLHGTPEAWRASLQAAPVRVQWDPERASTLEELPWRAIQIGLKGPAVDAYRDEWIVRIEDVTTEARAFNEALNAHRVEAARRVVPVETPYPLPPAIGVRIGLSDSPVEKASVADEST